MREGERGVSECVSPPGTSHLHVSHLHIGGIEVLFAHGVQSHGAQNPEQRCVRGWQVGYPGGAFLVGVYELGRRDAGDRALASDRARQVLRKGEADNERAGCTLKYLIGRERRRVTNQI